MCQDKSMKKYYFLKTVPPRLTFQQDMTEKEMATMKQHVEYWTEKTEQGFLIVFGPVFDPNGGYGIGIAEVDNEDQLRGFVSEDPAVKSGLMKTEYYPMRAVLPQKWYTL